MAGVIVTVLAAAVLPIAAFALNFVSAGVDYHTLMMMGVCFIYVLLLLYVSMESGRRQWEKC